VAELTMAELTRDRGVSVRVTGLDGAGAEIAARYGETRVDGEWFHVGGVDDAEVPGLVGELVARGGAIHAVVPTHRSLEEQFMTLLGASPDSDSGSAEASPVGDSGSADGSGRTGNSGTEAGPATPEARRE
jgi:hypothetical protein